ncbi:hypothetical protein ATCCBAA256_38520 [Mycobacterium montefiorense]|nr:hypothetical protein ATCCBAA256_38520 [Mycobacterium montefiorense]
MARSPTVSVKSQQPAWPPSTHRIRSARKEPVPMDLKERKRKRALIIIQVLIYGYLLTMFGIQLYMSFARGWWDL